MAGQTAMTWRKRVDLFLENNAPDYASKIGFSSSLFKVQDIVIITTIICIKYRRTYKLTSEIANKRLPLFVWKREGVLSDCQDFCLTIFLNTVYNYF